jgi:hypothetical protein
VVRIQQDKILAQIDPYLVHGLLHFSQYGRFCHHKSNFGDLKNVRELEGRVSWICADKHPPSSGDG